MGLSRPRQFRAPRRRGALLLLLLVSCARHRPGDFDLSLASDPRGLLARTQELGQRGAAGDRGALAELETLLGSEYRFLRTAAASAIAAAGPPRRETLAVVSALAASPDPARRRGAAELLARLGSAPSELLLALAGDPEPTVRVSVLTLLAQLDSEHALRRVLNGLTADPSHDVRAAALAAIPLDDPELPVQVLAALADPWPEVRLVAARRAASVSTPGLLPALIALRCDPDSRIWSHALDGLRQSGPIAAPALAEAVSVIAECQSDPGWNVLRDLGEAGAKAVLPHLDHADPEVRVRAVRLLESLGQGIAREPLEKLLGQEPSPEVRVRAVDAIASLGTASSAARGAIERALSDADDRVRCMAELVLPRVRERYWERPRWSGPQPLAPAAADELIACMRDDDRSIRAGAAWRMTWTRGPSAERLPELVELLFVADPGVRGASLHALTALGAAASLALPAILSLLDADDANDIVAIANAVRAIPAEPEQRTHLQWALARDHEYLLVALLGSAAALGPAAAPMAGRISELASDRRPQLRNAALAALTRIGPDAGQALPAVVQAIASGDAVERRLAIAVVTAIGPGAHTSRPALLALLRDLPEEDVWTILAALAAIDKGPPRRRTSKPRRDAVPD